MKVIGAENEGVVGGSVAHHTEPDRQSGLLRPRPRFASNLPCGPGPLVIPPVEREWPRSLPPAPENQNMEQHSDLLPHLG